LDNQRQSLLFYQFLGSHSLLIGLLPFYLPVFLWGIGFNLAHITLLIGVSGLSFCGALSLWQQVSRKRSLKTLICLTFALECALVACTLFANTSTAMIVMLGIANGLYNGFFWTTQRTLFLKLLGQNDTGKRYGNFQIFVTVFLKIGILIGGWLLDAGGLPWLLGISVLIGGLCSWWFYMRAQRQSLHNTAAVSLAQSLRYQDKHRSRGVFIADGFFLFLESHYWTLSLFMLADENYARLGVIVVVLALLFGLLFYLIKNTIDSLSVSKVYAAAVVLYALSWLLRCFVSDELGSSALLILLMVITFCSSFFRLAFNKRFFDIAQLTNGTSYLIIKSYQSQFFLGCGFIVTAAILSATDHIGAGSLTPLYAIAAIGSFVYLLYRLNPQTDKTD